VERNCYVVRDYDPLELMRFAVDPVMSYDCRSRGWSDINPAYNSQSRKIPGRVEAALTNIERFRGPHQPGSNLTTAAVSDAVVSGPESLRFWRPLGCVVG
jgi:hypothetical protein